MSELLIASDYTGELCLINWKQKNHINQIDQKISGSDSIDLSQIFAKYVTNLSQIFAKFVTRIEKDND